MYAYTLHLSIYIYIYIYIYVYMYKISVYICVYIYIYSLDSRSGFVSRSPFSSREIIQDFTAQWSWPNLQKQVVLPVSVKKHFSGEEDPWENQLEKHQIRGWTAVSAAGLQGQGSHKRSDFSDTRTS